MNELITTKEIAKRLHLSESGMYSVITRFNIKPVGKISRERYYTQEDVETIIKKYTDYKANVKHNNKPKHIKNPKEDKNQSTIMLLKNILETTTHIVRLLENKTNAIKDVNQPNKKSTKATYNKFDKIEIENKLMEYISGKTEVVAKDAYTYIFPNDKNRNQLKWAYISHLLAKRGWNLKKMKVSNVGSLKANVWFDPSNNNSHASVGL